MIQVQWDAGSAYFAGLWVASVVAATIVGFSRKAGGPGFVAGLFLGPMGVLVAFRMDNRERCTRCQEPHNDLAVCCPHCGHAIPPPAMTWPVVESRAPEPRQTAP
jgi:hypothetical protein